MSAQVSRSPASSRFVDTGEQPAAAVVIAVETLEGVERSRTGADAGPVVVALWSRSTWLPLSSGKFRQPIFAAPDNRWHLRGPPAFS